MKFKKLKIFDDSRKLKALKIIALAFLGILLLWFTFNITGLKIGDTKIVVSAFVDEPIDFVFYLIFIASIVCFILKDTMGKYFLSAFLLFWGVFQFTTYFKTGENIAAYNKTFADTHHIIAASQNTLVKDTYHIFLDIFILFAFITIMIFLIVTIVSNKKKSQAKENL